MNKIKTSVRKWGNSFGIVLPKKIIDTEKIIEGTEITITIEPKKAMTVKDLMEFAKKNKIPKSEKPIKQIIKEIDRDLWNE